MQKILLAAALTVSMAASAQFNVETHDGTPITDGSTFGFNTLDEQSASLKFYVNNESTTQEIYMKIEFVSAVNYDGTDMQLCFGLCYDPISVGTSYPPGNEVVTIQPGSNQGTPGDKFWNYNDGGGNAIEYEFRFYQVDGSGTPTGEELSFTYLYDPTLGVEGQNKVNASLLSTVVSEDLQIVSQEEVNVKIYNLLGALVAERTLSSGTNSISLASLESQVYMVQMTNESGATSVEKIVKR